MKRLCVLSIFAAGLAAAAAPPVEEGLILHLDAAVQAAAREQPDGSATANLQPLDRWLDASGTLPRAFQPWAPSRPKFRVAEDAAFVTFDGRDDFLPVTGPDRAVPGLTVIILAAPKSNAGGFSGLFSTASAGRNDYVSGLNLDFGPHDSKELSVVNVESAGSGGARDLLQPVANHAAEFPFGGFHVFTVRSRVGDQGNEFFLDGVKRGSRPRAKSRIALNEMVIGGRLYSNNPSEPPHAQGFFHGEIAAVLVYDRALTDGERGKIEGALLARVPALDALGSGRKGHALEVLDNPPPLQMLAPGFTVHELPVKLRNQNNLRYRHDGRLVALGYDGRIHLLTDSDGDGLEDQAAVFWDKAPLHAPIGTALLPKDDPRGDGVYVASKAKVSLILDRDRDGVAEEEIVVASGWKETFQGVDTVGLAVDPGDGSIYFSLGCENFANAYLVDSATGKSGFKLSTERGTIQRVSPDFSKRETVCTGVRFACALAFNRHGDLFATDQEGATWLPNGNPLDELLHIVPGRHYGFPPRHPKHLPQVIDEPPVIEYGPQHQSTVGMVFNEGVNGGPAFGPAHWHGDALVCGESRGKLYRTQLAQTDEGYAGQNHLIACLGLLTVDACVSPGGDLLVACHSGPPDWGTGPTGDGRIFKVRYANQEIPQPVTAWAAAPDEFRIAFDRPLDPANWTGVKEKVRIEAGQHVKAGDRYETIRPGYQVVRDQIASPRRWVPVDSLALTADQRTVVLRVPRQNEPVGYAVTLPVPEAWRTDDGIEQRPEMDMAVSLNGIEATLEVEGRSERVMLPHPSFKAAKSLTRGSADHAAFFRHLESSRPNARTLTLAGQVEVSNVFVPATQPGSKLDWDVEDDPFASRTMTLRQDFFAGLPPEVPGLGDGANPVKQFRLSSAGELNLDGSGLTLALDDEVRPVFPRRLHVPWAAFGDRKDRQPAEGVRSDVKGNWLQGRRLFFGEAGCATCHTLRGEGSTFGPDLSNLVHRDRGSVITDILQPSATINPDHAGTLVTLADGGTIAGMLRSSTDDKLVLALPTGAQADIPRANVAGMQPPATSLMPAGLDEVLTPEALEDLLTFLLVNPLEPAPIVRTDPPQPPPRKLEQVAQVLGPAPGARAGEPAPLRILLCAGPKDHGPDEHDYPLWFDRWSNLLALADNVTVTTSMGFPSAKQLGGADVAVFYNANPGWDSEKAKAIDKFHERGGGAVYIHYAVNGGKAPDAAAERMGLTFTLGSRFRHGEFDLVFTQPDHPITHGFPTLRFTDETYWNMRGDVSRLNVLGNGVEEGKPRPQLWTMERKQSRIVTCIPGHYNWTFDDPLYRALVLRCICWAARQDNLDRLAELSLIGARISR